VFFFQNLEDTARGGGGGFSVIFSPLKNRRFLASQKLKLKGMNQNELEGTNCSSLLVSFMKNYEKRF
jgi:hypothetical protein